MGQMRLLLAAILAVCVLVPGAAQASPRVVVTIKPLYGITASVMEGVGTPELLIEGAESPHTFQFRPSQMRAMSNADLLIWVGPLVEMPLAASMDGLSPDVGILEMAAHPALIHLPYRAGGIWAAEHAHHDEGHGDEDASGRAHNELSDPHLWLDPRNGILMARLIAEALGALDPEHASRYTANADVYAARLSALDAALRDQLAPYESQSFIVFHDAFQYFEARYGLRAAGSIAIDPERSPGPRTIMALRAAVTERHVACVFAEPQFNTQLVETVIEGSPARAATLDPLGAALPATTGVYEDILQSLANDFAACMNE